MRVEEQWTATNFAALRIKLMSLGKWNSATYFLLEEQRIIRLTDEWADYVTKSVTPHINLLKQTFEQVDEEGSVAITSSILVQCHEAETMLRHFLDPLYYDKYDYGYAVKLIDDHTIQIAVMYKERFIPYNYDCGDDNDDDHEDDDYEDDDDDHDDDDHDDDVTLEYWFIQRNANGKPTFLKQFQEKQHGDGVRRLRKNGCPFGFKRSLRRTTDQTNVRSNAK